MSYDPSKNCRLCGGAVKPIFRLTVLGKHEVDYCECSHCLSLQTTEPFWLDEAYGSLHLANTDTGVVQRNLNNFAASYLVAKLFQGRNLVDMGGGDGLLCRLLRDYGLNCYVSDKHARPTYGQGFTTPDFEKPDLLMGFEVLEHFPRPSQDLEALFQMEPKSLLLTTALYRGEGKDWWYLAPESGQHIFFYSPRAMELIAEKYQYDLVLSGGYILLSKKMPFIKKVWAKIFLKRLCMQFLRLLLVFLPPRGVWRDYLSQVELMQQLDAQPSRRASDGESGAR